MGIVADSRAMRQELRALKHGLTGRLKVAAIPTALPMVSALTTPFRARHPSVTFTILSRTSIEILSALENLEVFHAHAQHATESTKFQSRLCEMHNRGNNLHLARFAN